MLTMPWRTPSRTQTWWHHPRSRCREGGGRRQLGYVPCAHAKACMPCGRHPTAAAVGLLAQRTAKGINFPSFCPMPSFPLYSARQPAPPGLPRRTKQGNTHTITHNVIGKPSPHGLVHVDRSVANVRQAGNLRPVLPKADGPGGAVGGQPLQQQREAAARAGQPASRTAAQMPDSRLQGDGSLQAGRQLTRRCTSGGSGSAQSPQHSQAVLSLAHARAARWWTLTQPGWTLTWEVLAPK